MTEIESTKTKYAQQIAWLPNFSKGYAIRPTGFIGEAKELAGVLTATMGMKAKPGGPLTPGLHRLRYSDAGVIEGLERVDLVKPKAAE